MIKYILASQSPRRKELLSICGYEYEVIVSDCEEIISSDIPCEVVCELSKQKAVNVANKCCNRLDIDDIIVIGADTVVAYNNQILGKPKDKEEARHMLSCLQGKEHFVYTGVTFAKIIKGKISTHTFYEATKVFFNAMTEKEIEEYVDTKDPLDKAGAYGIQSGAAKFVNKIEGDYNNVVGLPIARLYQELKKLNFQK